MLRREPRQATLTISLYDLKVPQTHLLRRIAAVVDFSFVFDLVKETYYKSLGRPGKEPELLFKLLFLQFLYDLSDEEVAARAETDLAFLWFLGLLPEDHLPEASTLSRFRIERLGLERVTDALAKVVEQCKVHGLISAERVIVDSTDMAADVAVLTPSHTLRRAAKRLVKAVTAEDAALSQKLAAMRSKYDPNLAERQQQEQAAQDLNQVVNASQEAVTQGRVKSAPVLHRLEVARKVTEREPTRVVTTTDMDARFGRKGR